DEFERLGNGGGNDDRTGLGLGLSIANRVAQLLGHPLSFDSQLGLGSVFRIVVPLGQYHQRSSKATPVTTTELDGLKVLCIDNEVRILTGMQALLETWGCQVVGALTLGEALQRWGENKAPDIVLADYHLDANVNGLDVLQALALHWNYVLPGIVISADNSDKLREEVKLAGYLLLAKPVKPGALRALMRRLTRRNLKGRKETNTQ
ncbi:MAG: hybrid sensor histidine kinase/response regulator, partial [Spongiibacteraceae bacterium]|nr:hybrid sensor histidine kinase/response regulator [Spongiibacteraceae bacterium]